MRQSLWLCEATAATPARTCVQREATPMALVPWQRPTVRVAGSWATIVKVMGVLCG